MTCVWLPEARDDVQRLFDFLIERDPDAAHRAMLAIMTGTNNLEAHSELGRWMNDDTQRRELFIPFGAGAYVIRYRIHRDTLIIIRVWHCRELRDF